MVDVARANMFGFPVGTFRWDERYGIVQFEYDHSFVGRGLEPSPLMMPVQVQKTVDIHPPKTGISVHFSDSFILMALQI